MPQDFSKMSDQELLEFVKSKTQAATQPTMASPKTDYSKMSDQELVSFVNGKMKKAVEGPSLGEQAMDTVVGVGRTIDSYTGAPVRSALSELTRTTNEFGKPEPSILGNIGAAGSAFINQFGNNPDLAPTGMDIAENRLGLSAKPILPGTPSFSAAKGGIAPEANAPSVIAQGGGLSPAGIAGTAIDVGADLTNLVPGTAALRAGGRGAGSAAKFALGVGEAALDASKGIPYAGVPIKATASAAKNMKLAASKLFNPKVADDFKELSEIAAKNGIDVNALPESVEFGEGSLISRMSRVQREGPLGEPLLEKFEAGLNKVRQATDNKIAQFSGGNVLSEPEAGSYLRGAYAKGSNDFMKGVDVTYDKILEAYPGLGVKRESLERLQNKVKSIRSSLEERKKFAIGSAEKSQIKTLEETLDHLESTGVYQGFASLRAIQKSLGRVAFGEKNPLAKLDIDTAELRGLYREIKDVLIDTADTIKDKKGYRSAIAKLGPEDTELKAATRKKLYAAEQLKKVLTGAQYMAGREAYLDKFLEDAAVLGFDNDQIKRIEALITNFDDVQRGGTAYDNLLKNVLADIDQKEAAAKISDQYLYMKENALHEEIRTKMGDVGKKLKENNAAMSQLFDDKSLLKTALGGKNVSDESAFRNVFSSTNKIEAIKKVLKTPEELAPLKGAFLNSLIKRDTEGGFSFRQFRNALRNKMDVAEALFEPQELQEILELVRLGDRFGISIMSTSGTGSSNILKDVWNSLGSSVSNEVFLEALKNRARKGGGLSLPPDAKKGVSLPPPPLFQGARDFAPNAAIQLPKQMYIQRKNEEKRK